MILDSIPWKEELHSLIGQLTSTALPFEYDEDDRSDFFIERALIYSAFVARLLLDAKKTTDSINDYCMPVGSIPNKLENPEYVSPLLRRFPEHNYYDFENETALSVPCRRILNQIIHSFVIPAFEVDETGTVLGFFVTSDKSANKQLYHIKLECWVKYLEMIVNDDITTIDAHLGVRTFSWTTRPYNPGPFCTRSDSASPVSA